MTLRRLLTMPLATSVALLAALLLAACGGGAPQTSVSGAAPAQAGCDEAQVRQAIIDSDAVSPDIEFDVTYLACADGFGWATISAPDLDSATVLLSVSDAGTEVLNLGTSVCTADVGIPADVAAQIAPPGVDPAGECPAPATTEQPATTVPPSDEPAAPVPAEPQLTG